MRIRDWSSDVCSSDLENCARIALPQQRPAVAPSGSFHQRVDVAIDPDCDPPVEDQRARFIVDECATASGNHAMPLFDQPGDHSPFAIAKIGFAEFVEDFADGALGCALDFLVGVDEVTVEDAGQPAPNGRSEEHTSEIQSLMRISYAVFCLKK